MIVNNLIETEKLVFWKCLSKVQPQGVAYLLLNFCKFQPGIAYKSVAYKKSVYRQIAIGRSAL